MKKNLYRIFIMALLAVAAGCVYDYDPKDEDIQGLDPPLVVIDGDIIVGGITRVKIGLTRSLAEEEGEVLPLGASVWVESESGEVLSGKMVEDQANVFEINTEGLGRQGRYRLGVSIPDRGEYVSRFKKVLVSPPIDSITYSIADDRTFARVEVTTHDDKMLTRNNDAGEPLYCKWNYTENWESDAIFPSELEYDVKARVMKKLLWSETVARQYCFSEAVSSGTFIANTEKLSENLIYKSVINEIPNFDTRVMRLYSINVRQTALDKEAYIYWENIRNNTSGTGGLFGPQPSEIRGNIESRTFPGEVVVGYINVTTLSEKMEFIDWLPEKIFQTGCATVLVQRKKEGDMSPGNPLWDSQYNMGYRPVRYADSGESYEDTSAALWALEECTDCRVYSNSTRPDFWPR